MAAPAIVIAVRQHVASHLSRRNACEFFLNAVKIVAEYQATISDPFKALWKRLSCPNFDRFAAAIPPGGLCDATMRG
jgi:hypothetical protein